MGNAGVHVVVGNNFDELWEVVGVPLPDPHGKRIDVFVQLVKQGDTLDDHVVHTVHVELDLGSGVAVSKTQLGLARGLDSETLHHVVEVVTDASDNLWDDASVQTRGAQGLCDGSCQLWLDHSKSNLPLRNKTLFQ